MGSQGILFWAVVGLLGFFFALFTFRRTSGIRPPTRLNLKSATSRPGKGSEPSAVILSAEAVEVSNQGIKIKNLNVIFMYNGHSFDAHEVLGIPAGSQWSAVEEAYNRALEQVPPDSRGFVEMAFRALQQDQSSRG